MTACNRVNLNTSDSEIMISEQSDLSFVNGYYAHVLSPLDGTFKLTGSALVFADLPSLSPFILVCMINGSIIYMS